MKDCGKNEVFVDGKDITPTCNRSVENSGSSFIGCSKHLDVRDGIHEIEAMYQRRTTCFTFNISFLYAAPKTSVKARDLACIFITAGMFKPLEILIVLRFSKHKQ